MEESVMAVDWLAEDEAITDLVSHPRLPLAVMVIGNRLSPHRSSIVLVQIVS